MYHQLELFVIGEIRTFPLDHIFKLEDIDNSGCPIFHMNGPNFDVDVNEVIEQYLVFTLILK